MTMPSFTMRQLLEAGIHFGHHVRRWNPKMEPYIFGVRNKVHIIDLQQSVPLLYRALESMRDAAAGGGRVLFVGTKRQASSVVAEAARRCGQHFVNHRWLGGMLTNWSTVSKSIKRLKELDEMFAQEEGSGFTKKERLRLERERDKLDRALGGIKDMGGLPDMLFVIDTVKESIAIAEARKLGIPIAAVLDSNSDPDSITYRIPGNDDALRAITLYCNLAAEAILDGIQIEMSDSGVDLGESVEPLQEALPDQPAQQEEPVEQNEPAPEAAAEAAGNTPEPGPEAAPEAEAAGNAPEPGPEAAPEAEAAGNAPEPEVEAAPSTKPAEEPEASAEAGDEPQADAAPQDAA